MQSKPMRGARAFKQKLGAVLNAVVRHCCPVGKADAKARLGMRRLTKADVGSPIGARLDAFVYVHLLA